MNNKLLIVARWIIGAVFIFSGFVKGIDPWGFNYKLTDYIHSMNLNWLESLTFPGAFILPFMEFIIGVGLITGIFLRFSAIMAFVFMAFFTPLTLYIAIKNPVTDCGCFGDALVITNWQTFYKNIVLITLALLLLYFKNKISFLSPVRIRKILFSALFVSYIVIVVWSFNHEPVFDFRPFKAGVNIQEGMSTPEGAPKTVYKTTFYYRNLKTQELKKFNDNNYPWQDTLNWKFESMDEPVVVKKGYTPPIHDFSILTDNGDNITDFFLGDTTFVFLLIAHNLEKTSLKKQEIINKLSLWAKDQGFKFVCLTSSKGSSLQNFRNIAQPPYDFYFADEIVLKTIIRSNPGLLLLKKGTILAKWHYNDIPSVQKLGDKIIPEMNKKLINH